MFEGECMLANKPDQDADRIRRPDEVQGCLDVAAQAQTLITGLSDEQYTHIALPYLQSAIGGHMRHILDVNHAVTGWPVNALVDYDVRRRAHPVETERDIALQEWRHIVDWLETLDEADMVSPVSVKSEVCLSHQACAQMPSTLGRELAFVSSHAVHHLALIRVSLCAQGIETDEHFGLAPATLSHQRGEK